MAEIPERYDPKTQEPKWQEFWEKEKIYAFDQKSDKEIYSVDTPPPTVSGKMHVGHSFSYAQQDFVIRCQRMRGKNIFYPFGTDDNGLATERLIERTKKVRAKNMGRSDFVKLCQETLEKELRPQYLQDFKRLGLSCDFGIKYTTIDEHSRRISQREFINLYKMGRAYRKDAPAMWCPECNTGISQVECIDQELSSHFNDIVFTCAGEELIIATTRPELLPACVAIFYHPHDSRYKHLAGKKARVPLFNQEVPILEDSRADPKKGTGLVMCCTFGDQVDMEWQKAHKLPIKEAFTGDGKMTSLAGTFKGLDIKTARKEIIAAMKKEGLLTGQKPITHPVNVHERCGTEIEFIKSKQWFIKYLDLKEDMLKWGRTLNWHPDYMRNRYENWVHGLQWDWLISRQRYFGVPFPIWYCAKCEEPVFASEKDLPVDPLKDKPPITSCPKCPSTEFIPEKDVLDTWATSSLTPRLAIELMPKELWNKLYPMSLRPQAHDIITFWLFNTTFRGNIHYKENPWKDCLISGWALDPRGKKMSKSKGNIIEPQTMMDKYSADALRYWAALAKPGDDANTQDKDFVTGQKLVNKIWNASKFSFGHLYDYTPHAVPLAAFDRWLLTKLNKTIEEATNAYDSYEHSRARFATDIFFWNFCDNYLEIVKDRLYNPEKRGKAERQSAQFTLYTTLLCLLKLYAPVLCHVTEECYQKHYAKNVGKKSIHITDWPVVNPDWNDEAAEKAGDLAIAIISDVRKQKSEKKISLKTEIPILTVTCTKEEKESLKPFLADIQAVCQAKKIEFIEGTYAVAW
ncbi:MAG: valine--tRNA ligase [Nanoarchaeota archaeon]